MHVKIIPAEPDHAALIVNSIRKEQLKLINGDTESALRAAIKRARYAWTGFYKDEIACIVGVETSSLLDDTAILWLITAEIVNEHPFLFVRWSQRFIKETVWPEYLTITGYVDSQFEASVKWLDWLGFKMKPLDKRYLMFEMTRAA